MICFLIFLIHTAQHVTLAYMYENGNYNTLIIWVGMFTKSNKYKVTVPT